MLNTTIAHYQITSKLGQGGMGEVYRATDSKLEREVAIKVLPSSFADDRERVARFEREAKALAQLNHPHVAAVYDYDQREGRWFLTMELVEGEDLSTRLKRGALPVEEALDVCKQIAEALEAAHGKGIIHRDLKPANVKLTEDGQVKVLDFGLAKAVGSETDEGDSSRVSSPHLDESPTITADYTLPGTLLGTVAYMSPEQARGKAVDKRSDLWSFGCLLYECLTGKQPFKGDDTTELLASIIKGDPDWSSLPENTPPYIHLLLRKCLAKDRRQRLHDIADARIDLTQAIGDPAASFLSSVSGSSHDTDRSSVRSNYGILAMTMAITITAALTWWISSFLRASFPNSASTSRHLKVKLELDDIIHGHKRTHTLISPDGSRILYQYDDGSDQVNDEIAQGEGLHVLELSQLKPRKFPIAAFGPKPFWSYDSEALGYFENDKLWTLNVNEGQAIPIATLPEEFSWNPWSEGGGAWLSDGRIVFTGSEERAAAGLWVVPDSGGDPELLLGLGENEVAFEKPSPLPAGKGVLFLVRSESNDTDIIAVYAEGEPRNVFNLPGESFASVVYDPRGYLLFDRATTSPGIWALPFSLALMKRTGEEPFLVADGTDPSVSEDGTLLYLEGTSVHEATTHQLVWLNDEGEVEKIPGMISQPMFRNVRLSADESQALVEVVDPDGSQSSIWIHDLNRPGINEPIADPPDGKLDFDPWFHPDEEHCLFRRIDSEYKDNYETIKLPGTIMKARLDGEGAVVEIVENAIGFSISGDGRYLVYERSASGDPGRSEILYIDLSQEELVPQLPGGKAIFGQKPQVSSDGRYMAYLGGDGRNRLYMTRFPSAEGRWQVTSDIVGRCFWGKDPAQATLYYYNQKGYNMSRVKIDFSSEDGAPQFNNPELIFDIFSYGFGHYALSDPSITGRRFLVAQRTNFGVKNERKVIFEQNWLRRFEDRVRQTEARSK